MVDIVIIGAGPAGYETALLGAKSNLKVVLIEKNEIGGTCLQVGCIPTKTFYRNAEVLRLLKESDEFGIVHSGFTFDFSKALSRKNEVVRELTEGIKFSLVKAGVELIYGEASLVDSLHVNVGDQTIETKYIMIATGSSEIRLNIPGNHLPNVITSKEILSIPSVPERLTIIGAGYIGAEFASIFSEFGSKITLIEFMDSIVPALDAELSKRLHALMKRQGIQIHTKTRVERIEQTGESLTVKAIFKEKEMSFESDVVLLATGRAPVFNASKLDAVGIAHDHKKILVNSYFQTSIPNIYAIGDVTGGKMLAHVASFQGKKALSHLLGKEANINFDLVPSAMFTFPEAASVGKTEEEAIAQGLNIRTSKYLYRANGKAMALKETDGFVKIIIDEFDHIIGAHIIGAHASDIIHELSSLMVVGIKIRDYLNIIHAHPTLIEVIQEAARGFE